jgi:hypothetical protein
MNKLAEKIVAAMTADELARLVDDHYRSESQTLTTAAEQNLLKLAELRGRLTTEQAARWADIKAEFVRQRRMGGGDADPVTKLVGTLSGLGAELDAIKAAITSAAQTAATPPPTETWLAPRLDALAAWLAETTRDRSAGAEAWLGPKLDALAAALRTGPGRDARNGNGSGPHDTSELLAQVRRIEASLRPVVGAAAEARAGDTLLANQMVQIIELLEALDARLRIR